MTLYHWKEGTRIAGLTAQTVAERLEYLRQGDGFLTPAQIVDDARPDDAPLHPAFEWDDTVAAERYREEQARALVRAVLIVSPANPAVSLRAYVSVRAEREDSPEPAYTATTVALADPALRAEVLAQALRDLEVWQRKYAHLAELAEVPSAAGRLIARQPEPALASA